MKWLAPLLVLWTSAVVGARLIFDERDCDPLDVDGCLAVRESDEWWFTVGAVGVWAVGAALIVAGWMALRDPRRDDLPR